MKVSEIKEKLGSADLSALYSDTERAYSRLSALADSFMAKYGEREDAMLLSVPGRSEICGNHTDHNRGVAIAAAIDRDIIAVAARRADGMISVQSEGRREDIFAVKLTSDPANFPRFKAVSLIAGVVGGFVRAGYNVGGFDAYTSTEVLSGSGLSSSAAFEVMIGNILNHLYNEGKIPAIEIAKIAQYAENVYFGKPCGLMDQLAVAVGGFVYMDFGESNPKVEGIDFSLSALGYRLCIVSTGGSHADLGEDYASIPEEMHAVARAFGKKNLSEVSEDELMKRIPALLGGLPDRALLRAVHFVGECKRVEAMRVALCERDMDEVLRLHRLSGHSSFEYLQNVFTTKHKGQRMSLAIALSDRFLAGKAASVRVHGGGFAGTIQAIALAELADEYKAFMDGIFGKGATMVLEVRPLGAVRII